MKSRIKKQKGKTIGSHRTVSSKHTHESSIIRNISTVPARGQNTPQSSSITPRKVVYSHSITETAAPLVTRQSFGTITQSRFETGLGEIFPGSVRRSHIAHQSLDTYSQRAPFSSSSRSQSSQESQSSPPSANGSTEKPAPRAGRKGKAAFTLNSKVEVITKKNPGQSKSQGGGEQSSKGGKGATSSRAHSNTQNDQTASSQGKQQYAMRSPKPQFKRIPVNPDYYNETIYKHPEPQDFDKFLKPSFRSNPSSSFTSPDTISAEHSHVAGTDTKGRHQLKGHGHTSSGSNNIHIHDDDIPSTSTSDGSPERGKSGGNSYEIRKAKEDHFLSALDSLNREVHTYEESIARPIQDLIVDNFSQIQSLAMRSRDAHGHSRKSAKRETIHVMENIGGGFRGQDALPGGGAANDDGDITWSLPKVDGVDGMGVYGSTPKLDPSRLPTKARQLLAQAERKVLLQYENQQKLIGESTNISDVKGLPALTDELKYKKMLAVLQQQHDDGEIILTEQLKHTLETISKNLPLSTAFLPAHVDMRPQKEFIDDEDEALPPDTLFSVSVPDSLLEKQMKKVNMDAKEALAATATMTQKKKKKATLQPMKIPKESEIQAHYTKVITDAQSAIKDITQFLGYGTIVQTEEKRKILQNATNIDELTLHHATKDDHDNANIYPSKNAHFQQLQIADTTKTSLSTSTTTSSEKVVLPFQSPDGYSDEHLPALLKKAIGAMETAFNSMKETVIPSATVYTSMMSTYAQLGLPARAALVFDDMRNNSDTVPDTTSYNVMLDILTKDNKSELCCQLFHDMRNEAVSVVQHGKWPSKSPTHSTGRKMDKLRTKILRKARSLGIEDVDLSNLPELINDPRFEKVWLDGSSRIEKPTVDLIARPDVVTYTTVMKALGKANDKKGALKIFNLMKDDQVRPNVIAYTAIIGITMDAGDFKTGLRLFHDMKADGIRPSRATYSAMIQGAARGGEMSLTIALLHQMMSDKIVVDQYLIANMLRGIAESGNGAYALRLHSQFSYGKFGLDIKPTSATYNALLELIADPHSWGRITLPPLALKVGLAVYQEALIRRVFAHPYSEKQGTGIVDVRPYTRGSILFPIHFYLNLLVDHIPIYPQAIDRALSDADRLTQRKYKFDDADDDLFYYDDGAESSSSSDYDYHQTHTKGAAASVSKRADGTTTQEDTDITKALDSHSAYINDNHGNDHVYRTNNTEVDQPKVPFRASYEHIQIPKQARLSESSQTHGNTVVSHSTSGALRELNGQQQQQQVRPLPDMFFPRIPIAPKGVLFIASKELKPVWTSSPKPVITNKYAGVTKPEQYKPMIEYVESVLRNTRPWIHFSRLPTNPHALTVSSNILRFWVTEQGKRIRRPQQKKKRTMVYY